LADFSNYTAVTLAGLASYVRKGGRLYDELLLEAIDLITPSLLQVDGMQALRREIDPKALRGRGRPRKNEFDKASLFALVDAQQRPDVPQEIMASIIERLKSGRRRSEVDWAAPQVRERRRDDRDFIFWAMYPPIYDMLGKGVPHTHEVIGHVDLGDIDPDLSRHEQSSKSVGKVARERFALDTPSARTIANLISMRKKNRKVFVSDPALG